MCVRNLCEGNEGNQQYISELKPQQVVQDDMMASHGLSVEINPQTGRFQFKQEPGCGQSVEVELDSTADDKGTTTVDSNCEES